jgi:hypothetical protein
MKKYSIYTTNSTEPFLVETDRELITLFKRAIELGEESIYIQHKKELIGMGTYKYEVLLTVNNIVSITTSEKV